MRSEDLTLPLAHVFVMAGDNVIDVPLPQEDLRGFLYVRGVDLDNIEYADNRPPEYTELAPECKQSFDDCGLTGCWDYEVPACLENVSIPDSIVELNDVLFLLAEEPYDLEDIAAYSIVTCQCLDTAYTEYKAREYHALWVPRDNDVDVVEYLFDFWELEWEDDAEDLREAPLWQYEELADASGYVDIPGDSTWYVQFRRC